jgi:hypothetical protein
MRLSIDISLLRRYAPAPFLRLIFFSFLRHCFLQSQMIVSSVYIAELLR